MASLYSEILWLLTLLKRKNFHWDERKKDLFGVFGVGGKSNGNDIFMGK